MSAPPPLARLPTLTEVVEIDLAPDAAPPLPPPPEQPAQPQPDTGALADEVLRDVQQRIELLLEQRLREALAPALARAAEHLIEESRSALVAALHETVLQAVDAAIQRRLRQPDGEARR